jgi:hypothetical protein
MPFFSPHPYPHAETPPKAKTNCLYRLHRPNKKPRKSNTPENTPKDALPKVSLVQEQHRPELICSYLASPDSEGTPAFDRISLPSRLSSEKDGWHQPCHTPRAFGQGPCVMVIDNVEPAAVWNAEFPTLHLRLFSSPRTSIKSPSLAI